MITLEYLRRECYLDLTMLIFIVADQFIADFTLDVIVHVLVLSAITIKLCFKIEMLRACFTLKKYTGLIDSVLLLIVFSHINVKQSVIQALLLFLSSKFVPEKCWLQHINIERSQWSTKYIYSLYWAITTIVTVGYGDITPQNEYEIITTIIIEVSGSALFGYIINVIGATMAELK